MEIKELTREEMGGLIAGIHALGKDRLRDLVLQIWQMSEGYEQVEIDNRRLVRELDVLINGENAAQQASLCDIVAQVRSEGLKAVPAADEKYLRRIDEALADYDTVGDAISLLEDFKAMLTGSPAPAVPEGWKLVPIEPTPEMCDISHVGVDVCTGMAADDEYYSINGDYAAKVYRAMLAAAPAPGGEHGN